MKSSGWELSNEGFKNRRNIPGPYPDCATYNLSGKREICLVSQLQLSTWSMKFQEYYLASLQQPLPLPSSCSNFQDFLTPIFGAATKMGMQVGSA